MEDSRGSAGQCDLLLLAVFPRLGRLVGQRLEADVTGYLFAFCVLLHVLVVSTSLQFIFLKIFQVSAAQKSYNV